MASPTSAKGPFVSDLRPTARIVSHFLVRQKQLEAFRDRSKGEFLSLVLADRTGEIIARVWDDAPQLAQTFEAGDIVKVHGDVGEYQGRPQLIIQRLRPVAAGEYDLSDYQLASSRPPAAMLDEIRTAIDGLRDPRLAELVRRFYTDPAFIQRLTNAPAALRQHRAYVGGLLEQITEMLTLSVAVAGLYPDVDGNLLSTGVLLYAVGKVHELELKNDVQQTDAGRLLGHVVMGDERVARAISEVPGFPAELALRLRHMLVSQHGRLDWGSPRPPQTLDALALHQIENLTAQVGRFRTVLDKAREPGQDWTEYSRQLGHALYRGSSPPASDEDQAPLE